MSEPIWYRSLYWRIAVGFVALVATLLVVQVLAFAWISGNMTDVFPSRSPAQLAASIAGDAGDALLDPDVADLGVYVNDRYSASFRSYVVVLTDGQVVESRRVPPPAQLVRSARSLLFTLQTGPRGRGGRDRSGPPSRAAGADAPTALESTTPGNPAPETAEPAAPAATTRAEDGRRGGDRERDRRDDAGGRGEGFGRSGGPSVGGIEYARIAVDGDLRGVVAVPVQPPPLSMTLRAVGPTLGVVALVLLVFGTAVAAVVIGRPTRRRLRELQDAARSLGAGQPGVRAPESGGDEVTALSRAFNDMAARLDSRTRALAHADRTRRQLLADVSHELMTPLAAIRGYVETLAMKDLQLGDDTRSRYLSIVGDEANRLEHIIGDLLDLARLEGGGGVFRVEDVSVDQLLERLRHRHGPVLDERHIVLTTTRDPGLATIRGDANRLEQALQNLVANAIRHTPSGGAVGVEVFPVEGGVAIRVDDSGSGIPEEHVPYVFDRFYKADESRTGTELPSGSGLGLSIVQAIVQRHGGRVTAANVPNAGARFEIFLPSPDRLAAQYQA